MQGLADGYFVLPVHDRRLPRAACSAEPVADRPRRRSRDAEAQVARAGRAGCCRAQGHARRSTAFHRELGKIMWDNCGMARNARGPGEGARARSRSCARSSGSDVRVPGDGESLNQSLEKAGRVADFLELAELMCHRRAAPRGVVRRALPRGVPDAGRRGAARRRELPLRRRLGVHGRRARSRAAQGAARVRGRAACAAELQVDERSRCTSGGRTGPDDGGRLRDLRRRTTSTPDMSFLEMLDVVNERLIAEGEEPIAFDHDCREGICGTCGLMINGSAHGPRARHHDVPAAHANFTDGDEHHVEPWRAAGVPGDQGPGRRPQRVRPRSSRPAATSRSHRQRAGRQRDPGAQGRARTGRWTPRRASAAARAWRRARTARRSCSPPRRSRTSTCCRRASPSAARARRGMVDADGAALRPLHELRRVRGGVPEGDLASTSSRR